VSLALLSLWGKLKRFFFFFVQNLDLCNLHYIVLRFASAGSSSVRDVDRIHTAVALGLHDPACRRSS